MITDRFPEGSPVNEKLKGLFAKFSSAEGYFEHIRPDPEGGNSVGHGDCHINNVLFQKNEVKFTSLAHAVTKHCKIPSLTYLPGPRQQ